MFSFCTTSAIQVHLSAIKKLPQKNLKISPGSLLFRNCLIYFKVLKPKTASTKINPASKKTAIIFGMCGNRDVKAFHAFRNRHHIGEDRKGYSTAKLWDVTPSFMGWTHKKNLCQICPITFYEPNPPKCASTPWHSIPRTNLVLHEQSTKIAA